MRWRLPAFLRAPVRPSGRGLAAAFGLGALIAAGQAPWNLWFVALPALCLFLALARRISPGWAGFAGGMGYVAAGMFWIVEPFLVAPEIYGWMAPFAVVLMGAGMGAFWALGAGLGARLSPVAGVALGLVASDALRAHVFTGFPWILFGHIWIDTPVAQVAAWIGPIGLSLLTLALAALPLMSRYGVAGAVAVLAVCWGFGAARLAAPDPVRDPAVQVRLVQPNAAQSLKWDPERELEFFYRHLDLTAAPPAAGQPRPDIVIWPETAVPFLLDDPGQGLAMASEAAGGGLVALGIQRSEGPRYYNSLAILGPGGVIRDVYDKVHLVPFGEYIPYGDDLARIGITAFAAQRGAGYTKGQAEQVLDLGPLGRAQPLICYESIFPQDIRQVETRPDWIMLVTNDAWFGSISGPWQHLAQARLIAIEFGLPVARSANTGVSAMIDAKGRVRDHLGLNRSGAIDAALPPALPVTVYARTGDGPMLAVLVLAGVMILLYRRNNRIDPASGRV